MTDPVGESCQVGHFFNVIRHHDGCRLVHPAKWDIGKFRGAFVTDADWCIPSGDSFIYQPIHIYSVFFNYHISVPISLSYYLFKDILNLCTYFIYSFLYSFTYTHSRILIHTLIHIFIHVYSFINSFTYTHSRILIHIYSFTYAHSYTHSHIHSCILIHKFIYVYSFIYSFTYSFMYILIYVYSYHLLSFSGYM